MATTIFGDESTSPKKTIFGDETSPQRQDEDSEGMFWDGTALGELGEGVVSGGIGIVEGLFGLGAMGVDLVADTNYGDTVTETAESIRDTLGIDPEGFIGKGAELVTQFVVPGIGVASKVGKAAMAARAARGLANTPLTKAERFGLAAKELAAAGLTDAAVSTDNMTSLGDWAGGGITQTTDLIGLKGREKALARFGNKLKIGGESVVLGGALQGAFTAAGTTIGKSKVGQMTAKAASKKLEKAGQDIDTLLYNRMTAKSGSPEELSKGRAAMADAIAFFRYRGYMPGEAAEKRLLMDGKVNAEITKADKILKQLDGEIETVLKNQPEGSALDDVTIMTKIQDYLTEADPAAKTRLLGELPAGVRQNARRMRTHMTKLSKDILKSDFLKENKYTLNGNNVNDIIEQNLDNYMRRRYKIHEDAKYKPTDENIRAAEDFFMRTRKTNVERQLTQAARKDVDNVFTQEFLTRNGLRSEGAGNDLKIFVEGNVTRAAANKAVNNYLEGHSVKARQTLKGGRVAKDRLDTGMFVDRKNVPKTFRRLLGEVDDPRQSYLSTVADLSQFSAVDDYFATITNMAARNQGIGKLFKNGESLSDAQKQSLTEQGYVKLGGANALSTPTAAGELGEQSAELANVIGRSGWGQLDGYYVPQEIYKNLTNQILAEDHWGTIVTKGIFGTFLKGKAISQYGKTVLSPITQVRNFTTAVSFALANGNMPMVGRGGSLKDSARLVFSNVYSANPTSATGKIVGNKMLGIGKTPETSADAIYADLMDANQRGVLGTQAELREIQDSLMKGLDISGRDPRSGFEAIVGENVAKKIGKKLKPFEDIYQGSDDFWKYFNYNAEQAKIKHALEGSSDVDKIKYLTKNGADMDIATREALRRGEYDLDDLIKNRAAQIVRDTVPNYNKAASDAVKFGRKLPVGNFISFPAEMYRTGFNIVKQGIDDMASDIEGVRNRGRNRLLSFTATTAIVPAAMLEMAYQVSGVGREEMDAYKRSFAPEWEKGSVLIPVGRDENGDIEYINFSQSNPYDVLYRFANRMVNEADDAMREGKEVGQVIEDVGKATLAEIVQPFMSEAMFTEALFDTTIRGGRTSTGRELYNEADSFWGRTVKKVLHVGDTLMPSISPFNVSGGKLEPGRFARGVFGTDRGIIDSQDKMGRTRNATTELLRAATGLSTQSFNPRKGLEYGGFRLSQARTKSKAIFNRITDDYNAGTSDFRNAFVKANEAKYRVDREFYQMIEDLRAMGLKDSEMRRIFKKESIGGINPIMRGKFDPFDVTPKNRREMRDAGTYDLFPNTEINEIKRMLRGKSLIPDTGPRQNPTPQPRQAPSFSTPSTDRIQGNLTPSFSTPSTERRTPAPIVQARAPGPVAPELLGGDPYTAALNAQIANRQN